LSSFADKTFTTPSLIRNFCIIAHIDHGKSTLADRMLQLTGVVDERACARSTSTAWTSSASAASRSRRRTCGCRGRSADRSIVLHLIDTPATSTSPTRSRRALEACEGAVLLVDAAQGIEAQTLANLYLALEKDLTIIPVLNKIDLPPPTPTGTRPRSRTSSAATPARCCGSARRPARASRRLLDEVVRPVPPPSATPTPRPAR
jgi:GTP-binding protein LepA